MSEAKRLIDLLQGDEPINLEGASFCATTERDGYTETHQGNYWFSVEKTEDNYKVTPASYDIKKGVLVNTDGPIIVTEDDIIFYIVGTNRDSYTFPTLAREVIGEDDVVEKQVIQAFLAFVKDRFRFGVHNVFLVDEPTVVIP